HAATAVVNGVGTGITQTVAFSYSGSCTTAPTTVPHGASCTPPPDYAGDTNHEPSYGTAAVIITKAPTTTAITVGGATYDGNPHGGTAVVNGVGLSNQPVTVNYAGIPPTSYGPSTTAPTDAGTYRLRATYAGDDNHLGSQDAQTLTIDKAASTTVVSFEAGSYTYRGSAFTATVAVTGAGGLSLTPAPSYSGDCTNVTGPNGCTASYTWPPDANHTRSSASKTFDITKAASVTAITVTNATYDGSPHGGTAMVTGVGGLNQSVTVNYAGVSPTSYGPSTTAPTDAGTYRLRATFAGDDNHLGSLDAQTVTIAPASSTTAVSCPAGPYTYTGAAQMPCSATVTGASLSLTPTPSYANNTDAGTATASYTFAGDANHTRSRDSKALTVGQASSTTVVTCPSAAQTYTGSPQTPCSATATGAGGLNLAVAPVTYTNNTNVGTAGASATYAGDANHIGSTGTGSFTIGPASSTVTVTCTAGAP